MSKIKYDAQQKMSIWDWSCSHNLFLHVHLQQTFSDVKKKYKLIEQLKKYAFTLIIMIYFSPANNHEPLGNEN